MAHESARDALTFDLKQSTIAVHLSAPSNTINMAVEEANEFADRLLELTTRLLPSGFEVPPSFDSWQKDKDGYYFAHEHIEIWIQSRLVISFRLKQDCEIGPSDATRLARVLQRIAKIANTERLELIENGNLSMLGQIPSHPDVRELALKILDNHSQNSYGSSCNAIAYLCSRYPERFQTWCERYAEHPNAAVLYALGTRLVSIDFDNALKFLERAYSSPDQDHDTGTCILQDLMYLQKNSDSTSARKAELLLEKLSEI